MRYELPIRSVAHAEWCLQEAGRRYGGKLVVREGYPVIEDAKGLAHTDHLLRELGRAWRGVLVLY